MGRIIPMQEFYIIFRSYQGRSAILDFFLKDGFGHVCVMKKSGNFLLVIDPLTTGLYIDVIRPLAISQAFMNIPADMTVLYIKLPKQNKLIISHFANYIPSCVTCAKAVLGIRGWNLTPFGLYKRLIELKAEIIANIN